SDLEHGVAGVVSALIARDDREMRREEIDDLAFPFVAPLRAQHNEIHKRRRILLSTASRRATAEHAEIAEKYFSMISAVHAAPVLITPTSPYSRNIPLRSLRSPRLLSLARRYHPYLST